eukprot:SAG31_NODE_2_length_46263_cov_45.908043_13_plen_132_part_00
MLATQDSMVRQESVRELPDASGGALPGMGGAVEEEKAEPAEGSSEGSALHPTSSEYVAPEVGLDPVSTFDPQQQQQEQQAGGGLPEGWTAGWTPEGVPYYQNASGQSTWDPPLFLPEGWIQCVDGDSGKSW